MPLFFKPKPQIQYPPYPVWKPLEEFFVDDVELISNFMYMGFVVQGEEEIHLYKHIRTRRYLNLCGHGNTWRLNPSSKIYEKTAVGEAIQYVFG